MKIESPFGTYFFKYDLDAQSDVQSINSPKTKSIVEDTKIEWKSRRVKNKCTIFFSMEMDKNKIAIKLYNLI